MTLWALVALFFFLTHSVVIDRKSYSPKAGSARCCLKLHINLYRLSRKFYTREVL